MNTGKTLILYKNISKILKSVKQTPSIEHELEL